MIRNLIYHIYPRPGRALDLNLSNIRKHLGVFNGMKVFVISQDGTTESPGAVMDVVDAPDATWLIRENDSGLGESAHFIEALSLLRSTQPDEATFYGHAKGVVRERLEADPRRLINLWTWIEAMYELNLSDIPAIEQVFGMGYDTVGAFRLDGRFRDAEWYYQGTFFWFRHSAVFSGDWATVNREMCGVEMWPGKMVTGEKSFNLGHGLDVTDMYGRPPSLEECRAWVADFRPGAV